MSKIEDYLNDKLQTSADLDALDELFCSVREKQALLQSQHSEATKALNDAKAASDKHSLRVAQRIESFKKQQSDINRRLKVLMQSETSDDAVRKFDGIMSKLRRLEVAESYTNLLREVETLSAEARRNFKASPQAALKPYLRLRSLASALKAAQPAAEDAAPHLVDYVDTSANRLWQQMRDAFAQDLEQTLTKMKWPRKEAALEGMLEQEWAARVEKLLELQEPELKAREELDSSRTDDQDALVLLPLEIMVKPLHLRFRYHFEGEKATNRLDKPEFFFAHVLDLVSSYDEFLFQHLEPVLSRQFRSSNLALNPLYTDSTEALITALLPMLRQKILATLPLVAKQPQLLSHLMHEIMNFDRTLMADWGYNGGCGADGWKGLTWDVLVKRKWFAEWLQVEKEFALSRYQSIVSPTESHEIDYDSVEPGMTKPTKAAIRVNDLLETVTERYRPLPSFQHKLRFLVDIQITIFDKFHDALHSSLEAYLAMTSSIARTVQGISKEEQEKVRGVGGLERLGRVYGSAEYLERKLRDWNDNVFFIDLWDELQQRATSKAGPTSPDIGDMTLEGVARRTSRAVGSEEESGALFDETVGAYHRLRTRTEEIIQEKMAQDARESLRPYLRLTSWAYVASDTSNPAPSPELATLLDQITSYLSFLTKGLARVALRRTTRQYCLSLQSLFWDHILMRNNFSGTGIAQFQRDLSAIFSAIDRFAGAGQAQLGMRKLCEAVQLLGMTVEPAQGDSEEVGSLIEAAIGLSEVERRLFTDNESAREVLEELGLETLHESEARSLLERRVELAN